MRRLIGDECGPVDAATAYMPPTDLSNVQNETVAGMISSASAGNPRMVRKLSVSLPPDPQSHLGSDSPR